jgi:hypothetical protein
MHLHLPWMNAGALPNRAIYQNLNKLLVYNRLRMVRVRQLHGCPVETGVSHAAGGGFQPVMPHPSCLSFGAKRRISLRTTTKKEGFFGLAKSARPQNDTNTVEANPRHAKQMAATGQTKSLDITARLRTGACTSALLEAIMWWQNYRDHTNPPPPLVSLSLCA